MGSLESAFHKFTGPTSSPIQYENITKLLTINCYLFIIPMPMS